MKIIKQTAVIVGSLILSANAFSLTCPEKIEFKCEKPQDDTICPNTANATICRLKGIGQAWDFLAPDRNLNKKVQDIYKSGKSSSCSILSPGEHYTASYGLSYYGKISDGAGGHFLASYCLYVSADGGVNIIGLMSKNYIYDHEQGNWERVKDDVSDGWSCQNANECGFVPKIGDKG
jgi:hypothetical protein